MTRNWLHSSRRNQTAGRTTTHSHPAPPASGLEPLTARASGLWPSTGWKSGKSSESARVPAGPIDPPVLQHSAGRIEVGDVTEPVTPHGEDVAREDLKESRVVEFARTPRPRGRSTSTACPRVRTAGVTWHRWRERPPFRPRGGSALRLARSDEVTAGAVCCSNSTGRGSHAAAEVTRISRPVARCHPRSCRVRGWRCDTGSKVANLSG